MITGATRIMGGYAMASIKERIEIIPNDHPNFLEIIGGFEEGPRYLITNGRKMARRRSRGDLEVKVQTSGFSDPIVNAAVDSIMPTGAIRSENMGTELKEIECLEQYRKEIEAIYEMRDDYFLVEAQVKTLPWQDYRVLDSYLNRSCDLVKLVEGADCTYDGVKNRLKRVRNRIHKSTALYLERKYENNQWRIRQ